MQLGSYYNHFPEGEVLQQIWKLQFYFNKAKSIRMMYAAEI